MQCPKCQSELSAQDVSTIFGIREGEIDILAQGDMQVAFCCGTAVLFEKPPKEESQLIVPDQSIIVP